jgi:hypothetical protein
VQYASAAGTSWQVTKLSGNAVLQPGQYFLVQEAVGTGGTDACRPGYDRHPGAERHHRQGGAGGRYRSAGGRFAGGGQLCRPDRLWHGSYFEGTVAPTLSNTTAALRAAGGCTDTDNNGADFSTGAPAPRNRASALNVCGAPTAPPIVATCPGNLSLAFGVNGVAD